MSHLYFHCTSPDRVMPDRQGCSLDVSAAYARAIASIQAMLRTPSLEDWRGWKMVVLDGDDELLFEIPFSDVIGRAH